MKILGIGNAIVDVICKVNDNFIEQNNLTKSTMKLFFDENEFKQLLANLKFEKPKGWLSQKLSSSSNQVDQLANLLDERSIWKKYGF